MVKEEKIDFEEEGKANDGLEELTPEDMMGGNWIKNPAVGETLTMTVKRVLKNPNTTGTNSETGKNFSIGLKDKNGNVKRTDIECEEGVYTVGSWEVFFKLFGKDGAIMKYAREHDNKFVGAKVSITHNVDGSHASMKPADLAKIRGCTEEEATVYRDNVKKAIKERSVYSVKVE